MVRLDLLQYIDKDREDISVLDVGCACGTNLMWLKFHNPNARLQGIELNEKSAATAKWFGDIEATWMWKHWRGKTGRNPSTI